MDIVKEFDELYSSTYKILLRYVIIKCDNLSNVEDIIQNVYLKVYRMLPRKNIEYFNIPILIKLCKNELFKYYTLKNKYLLLFYDDKIEYSLENIKSKTNIEKDIIIKDSISNIWNIIKRENIDTQKIAALYFLEELKIKDIANLLKLNESTVKSRLYRLIDKIRKEENNEK